MIMALLTGCTTTPKKVPGLDAVLAQIEKEPGSSTSRKWASGAAELVNPTAIRSNQMKRMLSLVARDGTHENVRVNLSKLLGKCKHAGRDVDIPNKLLTLTKTGNFKDDTVPTAMFESAINLLREQPSQATNVALAHLGSKFTGIRYASLNILSREASMGMNPRIKEAILKALKTERSASTAYEMADVLGRTAATGTDPRVYEALNGVANDVTREYETDKRGKKRRRAADVYDLARTHAERMSIGSTHGSSGFPPPMGY